MSRASVRVSVRHHVAQAGKIGANTVQPFMKPYFATTGICHLHDSVLATVAYVAPFDQSEAAIPSPHPADWTDVPSLKLCCGQRANIESQVPGAAKRSISSRVSMGDGQYISPFIRVNEVRTRSTR
jgi:hypothetical protein